MIYSILLFIAIILNISAQVILKIGMRDLSFVGLGLNTVDKMKILLINPFFWGSLTLYGVGFVIYAIVLSKMELSRAYPISSISAITIIFLISILSLNESFNLYKISGLIFCILGILFLFR